MAERTVPTTTAEVQCSLKKQFPKINFVSITTDFVTATYRRTSSSRVKIKITMTFRGGYSVSAPVLFAIEGVNVPPGLKRKLEGELGEAASKKSQAFYQVVAALEKLVQFVDTNRFVPCWKELRQVMDLISSNGDSAKLNDSTGLIKLSINAANTKYHYKCSIHVDPEYPETANIADYGKPCKLKLDTSNFPESVKAVITQHAKELIRRLQDGMPEEHALRMSNPVQLPSAESTSVDETPGQAWQREDQERRRLYRVPLEEDYDGSDPQLSLLTLVKFIHNAVRKLPGQVCPVCNNTVLHSDPLAKKRKSKRPIFVHCGHWYHWGCFDQVMNNPPFGVEAACAKCHGRIYHRDWELGDTVAERERIYQRRQANEREMNDVVEMF